MGTGFVRPVAERVALLPLEDDGTAWDAFVAGDPDSSFCHLAGWREVFTDVLGHQCLPVAAVGDDGTWLGILPLVHVRSRLFGRYLVSLPFLNYGGPLGGFTVRAALERQARAEAKALGVEVLEVRNRGRASPVLAASVRKITVLLDLPATPDELWRTFSSKLRSQVRRASNAGLVARFGFDQREPFYEVFARNMRDLGTPVMPAAWFERIARVFPDMVEFGVVYQGDVPVAAGCGFRWRDEFELTWASSLREFNHLAGNMLLYWSLMQRVIENGGTVFNFGRCTPGGGTHRFKRQWGGSDLALPWGQWTPGSTSATPNPDAAKYRMAIAMWRRLPLPVANAVGPMLARIIP